MAASSPRRNLLHLLFAVLIGTLFLLPHVARMATLHTIAGYSPFSALSSSPATMDETYLYAAEVNYSYRQHRLAYDTDAFEHRNEPVPYSALPSETEVLLATLFHSVKAAQLLCYFLFTGITAWLLMKLFMSLNASTSLAAMLALVTLVASFSLRTLEIGIHNLLFRGLHSGFIETLQASRNPNPNMTFPLFLGALLAHITALRRRLTVYAVLAGVLGGLLFYSYIYYGIAWAAAAALMTILAFLPSWRDGLAPALTTLLATIFMAVPFLLWVRATKRTGGYFYRSNRLGMVHSHLPSAEVLKLSLLYSACLLLVWIAWWFFLSRRPAACTVDLRYARLAALVFVCAVAGGILGMNMQIVTGFNVQAAHHFPHMVIQPALILLVLIVLLVATDSLRRKQSAWPGILFTALFLVCAANQVEAGVNSAPLHRIIPWEQTLFDWLNNNTHPCDVVATTSLELTLYVPVYSQDCTLTVHGSRTSASDDEILDRYLLAEALVGAPANTVASNLEPGSRSASPSGSPWTNYPAFFYEYSPYLAGRGSLKPEIVDAALARYRTINLADWLRRFRVDYLYATNGQNPAPVMGYDWQRVLVTTNGTLWRLHSQSAPQSH